jgi:hypothetical protein
MVQDVIGTRQIRSQPTFFSQILFDLLNKTPAHHSNPSPDRRPKVALSQV